MVVWVMLIAMLCINGLKTGRLEACPKRPTLQATAEALLIGNLFRADLARQIYSSKRLI